MDAELILNPVRLLHRATHCSTDGKLRCPRGHVIKHRPIIGSWVGLTCLYTPPPRGMACGCHGYFLQGLSGVFAVEATTSELFHVQFRAFTAREALDWFGVTPPVGFQVIEAGQLSTLSLARAS